MFNARISIKPLFYSIIALALMLILPACSSNKAASTAADVAALTEFIVTVDQGLSGADTMGTFFTDDEKAKFQMVVHQLEAKRAHYKVLADHPERLLSAIASVDNEYWQLYTAYFTLRTLAVDHWPDYPAPVQQKLMALNRQALAANAAYHNLRDRISSGAADMEQLNAIFKTALTVAQMAAVMR